MKRITKLSFAWLGLVGLLWGIHQWTRPSHPALPSKTKAISHEHGDSGCGCGNIKISPTFARHHPKASQAFRVASFHESQKSPVEIVANQANVIFLPGREDYGIGKIIYSLGGHLVRANKALKVYTFSMEKSSSSFSQWMKKIQKLPMVKVAEPDYTARTAMIPNDEFYSQYDQDSTKTLRLEKAWEITTGSPKILVAVLDTGVDFNHEDLQGNLETGWNFVQNNPSPEDDCGHGTAMAGIIAARGNNGKGIAGVAWQTKILPLKVADKNGVASFSALSQAIVYATDQGARIINLSLGSLTSSTILHQAVQYAHQKGVILIGATGNDMIHRDRYPANYPEVLSVASVGVDGDLGIVTNFSTKTDVAAPGEYFWSTIPGNLYALVEGSSASTAFVSGVAALVLAQNPNLTNDQVYEILRQSTRLIPSLSGQGGRFNFGYLDAVMALSRSSTAYPDGAVKNLSILPKYPLAGQAFSVQVEVRNEGSISPASFQFSLFQDGNKIQSLTLTSLASGKNQILSFTLPGSSAGNHSLEARLEALPGETELGDNSTTLSYTTLTSPWRDLEVQDLSASDPILQNGKVILKGTIRNNGNTEESSVEVQALIDEKVIASQNLQIPAGQSKDVQFIYTPATPLSREIVAYQLKILPVAGEAVAYNNMAGYHFVLVDPALDRPEVQYAQKGSIDFTADAPYRIIPGRPYIPILLFVPDKGAKSLLSFVYIDKMKVQMKDNPQNATGRLIYEDSFSTAPTATTSGMEIVDEEGNKLMRGTSLDLNIFQDQSLRLRGKHNILRFPRASLGLPVSPKVEMEKYFAVDVSWSYYRHIFWFFYVVQRGNYHKTLKVRFPTEDLPRLPGEGKYYDVHNHTIAEWDHSPFYQLLAAKKDWGGPIQMVKENAFCWGFINSPNDIKDNIITTDHNCFYNEDPKNIADSEERPPVGPTSPASNPKAGGGFYTEREAYKRLFGETRGEEIAFTKFPMGAHMLVYRAQHFDGSWHGGSIPLIGGAKLELPFVLGTMAKQNRAENFQSFAYAAHPFSSQGWDADHIDQALGLNAKYKDDRYVHQNQKEFVFKGLQFFNGRGERNLPSSDIHFNNLNPFANSNWQHGWTDWDGGIQSGMLKWHKYISDLLVWSFQKKTEDKFIRKVYIAGGSDAHGAFNYADSRLAAVLPLQSTYSANSNAWGRARTYVFGDGKPGVNEKMRALKAYEDGNSVVTDGPLLQVSMDANGLFDSKNLIWHDRNSTSEDKDGQMGGGGEGFDGGRTMLVVRGSPDVLFRYRYENSSEFGSQQGTITSLKIYKDEPGNPNPTQKRRSFEEIKGVGAFSPMGNGQEWEKAINPQEEGTVQKVTAFSFGAFTGGDPDKMTLGADEYRCYTNPIWAIPVDFEITVTQIDNLKQEIPAGGLKIKLTFDLSMDSSSPLELEVKALDANGNSTGKTISALSRFQSAGWTYNAQGVSGSVFEATNTDPLALSGAQYPSANQYTFVVYTSKNPKDVNQNELNPIAQKFTVNYSNPNNPLIITANPVSTGSSGNATGGNSSSGSGSGGGCALLPGSQNDGSPMGWAIPFLVLLGALSLLRKKGK